jgi:predicted nucleotidyltransferase
MDTLGRPNLQHLLRHVLAEHGDVRLAILFGSRATGQARMQRDFELAAHLSAPPPA